MLAFLSSCFCCKGQWQGFSALTGCVLEGLENSNALPGLSGFMLGGCTHHGARSRSLLSGFVWIPLDFGPDSRPVFDGLSAFSVFVKGK